MRHTCFSICVVYFAGWEILIGGFLALGTAGVTAISIVLTFVYICLFFLIKYIIKKLRKKKEAEVIIIDTGGEKGEGGTDGGKSGFKGKMGKGIAIMAAKMGSAKKAAMAFINKMRGKPPKTEDGQASPDNNGAAPAKSGASPDNHDGLPTYEEAAAVKTVNETPRGANKNVNKLPAIAPKATDLPGRPQSGTGGTVVVGLAGVTSPRGDGEAGEAATGGKGDVTNRSGASVTVAPATDDNKVDTDVRA